MKGQNRRRIAEHRAHRALRATREVSGRRGLTLFEILLSLGIFLASMTALSQLVTTGMQAAVQSRLQTQAILRCESKLSEILAGVEAIQSTGATPFEDDPSWTWELTVNSGPHASLLELQVLVRHTGGSNLAEMSFDLTRHVRDPQLYLDAQAAAEEAAAEMDQE